MQERLHACSFIKKVVRGGCFKKPFVLMGKNFFYSSMIIMFYFLFMSLCLNPCIHVFRFKPICLTCTYMYMCVHIYAYIFMGLNIKIRECKRINNNKDHILKDSTFSPSVSAFLISNTQFSGLNSY
jgi:hypothetical protein